MDQKPDPVQALTLAFDKMVDLMFNNFDSRIWGIFGIVAFFMNCGRGYIPTSSNYNFDTNALPPGTTGNWIDGIVVTLLAVNMVIVIGTLISSYYFGAKAEFSMMTKIVTGNHESPLLFNESYDTIALSLFKLRAALIFLPQVVILLGAGFIGFWLVSNDFFQNDGLTLGLTVGITLLVYLIIALILAFIGFIINNFCIPIMFAKNQNAFTSLKEGFALFFGNLGTSLLFMLIKFGLVIIGGFIAGIAGCLACVPLLCCTPIMVFPIVDTLFVALLSLVTTVFVAPLYVLYTSYAMYFIQSHGSQYHMFGYTYSNVNPGPGNDGGGYGQPSGGMPPAGGGGSGGIYVQPTMEEFEAQQQQQQQLAQQFTDDDDPSLVNYGQGIDQQQGQDPYYQQNDQQGYQDPPYPPEYPESDADKTELYGASDGPPPIPDEYNQNDPDQTNVESQTYDYGNQGGSEYEVGNDDQSWPNQDQVDEHQGEPQRESQYPPPPLPDDDGGLPPPPPPIPRDDDGKPYPPPPPPPVN